MQGYLSLPVMKPHRSDCAVSHRKVTNQLMEPILTSISCNWMFISVFTRLPFHIPSQINLHNALPNYSFKIHFNSILTLMLQLSVRSAVVPLTLNTIHFSPTHATYRLSQYSSFHYSKNVRRWTETIKLCTSLYSISNHRSPPPSHAAISPLHPVLQHPPPIFRPQDETRRFTPILETKIIIRHIFISRPTCFDSKL